MFYITRTFADGFDLVGPFDTRVEAQRWSASARPAARDACATAVFETDDEPVFCSIVHPVTNAVRIGGDLPDAVVWAIEAGESA